MQDLNNISLLIISDNPTHIRLLSDLFEKITPLRFEVDVTDTVAQACLYLEAKPIRIVLLDYHLRGNADNQALIKLSSDFPERPILEFGDLHGSDVEQALLLDGAQDYLPLSRITPTGLMRAVCRSLERHKMISESEALKQNVHLLSEVKQVNEQLHRRNDEILQFYQTISHELKTPLTSIQSFASILDDGLAGELNEQQREYLAIILKNCGHMTVVINDLLTIASMETQKFQLDKKPVDIQELLERDVTAFRPIAEQSNRSLRLELEDCGVLQIDGMRITAVINNLLSNAVKYTDEGGDIVVRLRDMPQINSVEVSVADDGIGIGDAHLQRLFDRLYQVRGEEGDGYKRSGLGLGLHICQQIVELHNGHIRVSSELGRGSVFAFTLPKKQGGKHGKSIGG